MREYNLNHVFKCHKRHIHIGLMIVFFIIVVAFCCGDDKSSSSSSTTKNTYQPNSYSKSDYSECPACGAPYYNGYCEECGYPDINQGWLGENG